MPCCFWKPSSLHILVSRRILFGSSSDSTMTRGSFAPASTYSAAEVSIIRAHMSRGTTYRDKGSGAEARASVVPIIIAQLVDLDAPPVRRLMRHRLRHHQRLRFDPGYPALVDEEIWREIEMLLKRQFRVSLA